MDVIYHLENINDTAGLFLKSVSLPTVISFEGEMGAGKTTFIHALYEKMNMEGNFGSPTYSIINEYHSPKGTVYHIDLYRCRDEEEAIRAGVEECLYSGSTCFVEWPLKAGKIFPDNTLRVGITVETETTRRLKFISTI